MSAPCNRTTPEPWQLVDRVIEAIHEGLGGDGWAYANYGHNERKHMRTELMQAAREAIAVVRQWDAGK